MLNATVILFELVEAEPEAAPLAEAAGLELPHAASTTTDPQASRATPRRTVFDLVKRW
jgi:hypothetical protein